MIELRLVNRAAQPTSGRAASGKVGPPLRVDGALHIPVDGKRPVEDPLSDVRRAHEYGAPFSGAGCPVVVRRKSWGGSGNADTWRGSLALLTAATICRRCGYTRHGLLASSSRSRICQGGRSTIRPSDASWM